MAIYYPRNFKGTIYLAEDDHANGIISLDVRGGRFDHYFGDEELEELRKKEEDVLHPVTNPPRVLIWRITLQSESDREDLLEELLTSSNEVKVFKCDIWDGDKYLDDDEYESKDRDIYEHPLSILRITTTTGKVYELKTADLVVIV